MAGRLSIVRAGTYAVGGAFLLMAIRLSYGIASSPETLVKQAPLFGLALVWGATGWAIVRRWKPGLWAALAAPLLIVVGFSALGIAGGAETWLGFPLTPIQVLARIIFTLSRPDGALEALSNWTAWCWLAYLLHVGIVGWLLKHQEAPTVAERRGDRASTKPNGDSTQSGPLKRSRPPKPAPPPQFRLPDDVAQLYARNPYGVLGLSPHAAKPRQVLRRRDEMLGVCAAGLEPRAAIDGYLGVLWPNGATVDENEIRRAAARIQQDANRCREALLWFRLVGEPAGVLQALAVGNFKEAEAVWRQRGGPDASARINLAVLAHAQALAREAEAASSNRPASANVWAVAHEQWRQGLAVRGTWNEIDRLVATCSDPRIGSGFSADLREWLPRRLLSVHFDIARAALEQEHPAYARKHVDYVRDSKWPSSVVDAALDAFFVPMVETARTVLAPLLSRGTVLTDGSVDFGRIETTYRAAREPLLQLDAQDRLRPLADEVVPQLMRGFLDETNAAWATFCQADDEFFSMTQKLIELWNLSGDASMHRVLRQKMREHAPGLEVLKATTTQCVAALENEQVGFKLLACIARDADELQRRQVTENREKESTYIARANTEYEKTKGHFERNLRDMNAQLGS